ncbi:MAG TPA: hypothetical protein PLP88_08210, partial [Bacteroidales bacterium]|nr:hypothetical protein [Bacteroidales bacterium]
AELPKKPAVPQVNVSSMSSGVEVIITVPEGETEGVRIFRSAGTNGQPVAISSLLPVNGEKSIRFADTSSNLSGRTIYAYQARCELKGAGVSDLSEKALIRPSINTPPADPAFIRGAVNNNRINLIWQNTLQSDTTLTGYLVSRREGALPAKTINTGLNSWSDSLVRPGETYSYTINSIDNQGYMSPGACRLVVSLALNNPVPPDYIKAKRTFVNQYFTVIEWADVMFDGFTQFNLYRQAKGEEPVLIANLKPGNTRYTDKPEGENSLFRYFITTVHSSGAESLPSEKVMPE